MSQPDHRDPALLCVALLYGLGGLVCLLSALRPPNDHLSISLNAVMSGIGITIAVALVWLAGHDDLEHLHARTLTLGLLGNVLLTFVLMWKAGTEAGQVLTAFNFVYLTMVTTYFRPRRTSRAFVGLMVIGVLAVSGLSPITHQVEAGPVIAVAIVLIGEVLGALVAQIRSQATIDDLTGALNRSALREAATRALALSLRTTQPLTLLVVDLDGFKGVNDEGGHAAGDALLSEVTRSWRGALRGEDVIARVGGDEFVILLTNATRLEALTVVQRMHASHPARWSCGLAASGPGDDLTSLFARADAELYEQKAVRSS